MLRRLASTALIISVVVSACGGGADGGAPAAGTATSIGASADAPGVRVVSPSDARQLLANDSRTLIDVRTPEEYTEGHLAGAELIDFNASDFADRIETLDRDGSYVMYCRSGNRSGQARALMTSMGFTDVADIDGGILAWTDAGLPVEK